MTHDPFPREPLTAEEQALARRLAQSAPHGEPSAALDARILAAARAADAKPRHQPRPWPIAFGVAASLVLALGIAWRLRPLPGPAVEAPHPAASTEAPVGFIEPPPERRAAPAAMPLPEVAKPVATPSPPPSPAIAERRRQLPAPAVEAPAPPEPPVVLEAPAPAEAASAAPLPAPPPAAAPAPAVQAESAPAAARKAAVSAEPQPEDNTFDAAAAADQAAGDEPETDVPPASADSPEVRQAWLQRIRELVGSGQADAARASLKEFVRRHPDVPVPDDLRALQR